jgi:ABC-type sugar transport system substrate-binding protein
MKRIILVVFILGAICSIALAQTKEFVVGYIPMGFNNPHFEHERNGVVKGLQDAQGIKIKYQEMDGQWDAVKITNAFETLLAQNVNGIIISTFAPDTIRPLITEAKQKKIFVVAADVMIGGEDAAVITDNRLAGNQIGEYAVKRLKAKGNVLILEGKGNPEAEKRTAGFEEILAKYSGIVVLDRQNSNGDMNTAMNIMENWLQKYKKVDLVNGVNDPASLGALSAIEAANRQKEMFLVSVDGYEEGIQAIRDNRSLVAIAQQQPDTIGEECAKAMVLLLKGRKPAKSTVLIPTKLITASNLDESSF